jgi:hypothetical protein
MKEIPLTQGKVALVDDEDYEWLSQWKWLYVRSTNDLGYAARSQWLGNGKYKTIFMHRAILGAQKGHKVDHWDVNGLNNQRHNLRLATDSQNTCNQRKHRDGKSHYKGVHWDKHAAKWRATIGWRGHWKHLGLFLNEEDAARAYNVGAREYHGEFARLNDV